MASTPKLTKPQRRRRNKKARRDTDRWFDNTLGPIPAKIAATFDDLPTNIEPSAADQLTPEERAPSYLVDYGEEVPTLKNEVLNGMRSESAVARRDTRDDTIADLKRRYRDSWGRRGAAKKIASLENERGVEINVRTIQRYFKLSP